MDFSGVEAVLPTWKTTDLTVALLGTLAPAFAAGLRAVVVDNGSGEDSVRAIQGAVRESPNAKSVTFIALPRNVGFTNAVNVGVEAALAEISPPSFIWLLNPDSVVTAETLQEMLEVAGESGAGIVSAPEGGPGFAGQGRWPLPYYARPRDFLLRAPPGARWSPTGRCACWCSLVDAALVRQLIERHGFFLDGALFLDWDEWDVSLRTVAAGRSVVAALGCGASHHSTKSNGPGPMAKSRQYYQSRNALVVCRRHMPAWKFWALLPVHFARDASWLLRLRLRGKGPHEKAYIRGAVDGFRGRLGRWEQHHD